MLSRIFFNLLKINQQEFLFQFQSHPNYPSALAFSDTLNFLGVKNDAYKIEKEHWQELPEEFITLYKNNFALIKKEGRNYQVIYDDVQIVDYQTLTENSQDFVMLFHKTEKIETKQNVDYSKLIYFFFTLIIGFSFWQFSWFHAVFNLLSLAGIYISLELFQEKFGKESGVLTQFCGGSLNANISNCNKVIKSDKVNFFGLKLADFSFIYFVFLSILGLFFPHTEFILKILAFVSIIVIAYSLYIQVFVEKAFCKVCFIIILILLIQLAISSYYFNYHFAVATLILAFLLLVSLAFFFVFINTTFTEKDEFRKSNIKNLRFKRNYELFKSQLLKEEKINFENYTAGFFIGNKEAKLHISIISNPYCGYCKAAHENLEELIKKYPEDISAQIRFNYANEIPESEYTSLLKSLKGIYVQNSNTFLEALHFWFDNRDFKILGEKYPNFENVDLSELESITKENFEKEFTFTPNILINGYKFPDIYSREDIHYFIEDLLEDEDLQ